MKTLKQPKAGGGQNGEEQIRQVPLERIVRSCFNRQINPKSLDPEFIESIGERGIIQPLIVRPDPRKPVYFELVAGERRLTAARMKKLATVPVIVRQMTDTEAIELQAIENLQRLDLSPIEEAEKYKQLVEQYRKPVEGVQGSGLRLQVTVEEAVARVSERVGKGKATIFQALRLLKLPAAVKEACASGKLPPSHAAELARLEDAPEVQAKLLLQLTEEDKKEDEYDWSRDARGVLSFRDSKELIDDQVKLSKARAEWKAAAEAAQKKGQRVLTEEEIAGITGKYGNIGGGYVQGKEGATDYSGSYPAKTYTQMMGRHAPAVVLAHDEDYRILRLYKKTEAASAIEKAGHKKRPKQRGYDNNAYEREQKKKAEKKARMEPVIVAAKKLIFEAGRKGAFPWRLLVADFLRLNHGELQPVLEAHKWKAKGGKSNTILAQVGQMPVNAIPFLFVEIWLTGRGWDEWSGKFEENFAALAKHYRVDLEKLTKELAPEPKKEPKKADLQTPGPAKKEKAAKGKKPVSVAGREEAFRDDESAVGGAAQEFEPPNTKHENPKINENSNPK